MDCGQLLQRAAANCGKRALQFEGQWLREQVENRAAFCGLIGGSAAMRKVYQAIEAVAGSNASVVIRGESGVGKELVATRDCGERRSSRPALCVPELFGPARNSDGVGVVRLRKGSVYRGGHLQAGDD